MKRREAEAKRLLAEAGYGRGLEVQLMRRRGPLYEREALSRQDDLKKVGINLKIDLVDTATNLDRQKNGDFQVYTAPASVHMDDPDLYTMRDLPARRFRTMASMVIPSSISSSKSKAALSVTRSAQKSPERWSAFCWKRFPEIAAIIGNPRWATGIG